VIYPPLMFASLQPNGPQFTMASRLGEMLRVAEYLYGKRDRSYAFLGFEFIPANTRVAHNENRRELIIQIDIESLHDPMLVYYQLSYECIHLLSPLPNLKANTSVLEEGLATFYSQVYMQLIHNISITCQDEHYLHAQRLVETLLEIDRFAIKKLRQKQPTLSLISKKLILKKYPQLSEDVATQLTQEFIYRADQVAAEFNSRKKQRFAAGIYPERHGVSEKSTPSS
jgi:hypothetical protein